MRTAPLHRWLGLAVLGGAVLLVVVFLQASPADSGTDIIDGNCGSTESCAFENNDLRGLVADFNACEPDWYCGIARFSDWDYYGSSISPNDRTSSIANNVSRWGVYHQHSVGGGSVFCAAPGNNYPLLAVFGFDNKASSMYTHNGGRPYGCP